MTNFSNYFCLQVNLSPLTLFSALCSLPTSNSRNWSSFAVCQIAVNRHSDFGMNFASLQSVKLLAYLVQCCMKVGVHHCNSPLKISLSFGVSLQLFRVFLLTAFFSVPKSKLRQAINVSITGILLAVLAFSLIIFSNILMVNAKISGIVSPLKICKVLTYDRVYGSSFCISEINSWKNFKTTKGPRLSLLLISTFMESYILLDFSYFIEWWLNPKYSSNFAR